MDCGPLSSPQPRSQLFTPVRFGSLDLPNRIVIAPMCQYSAVGGSAVDWHSVHLGSLAISGAGLLFVEATAVQRNGRITPGCLGLFNDDNQCALQRVVDGLRSISPIRLGIQLAHAGRKGSVRVPWEGALAINPTEGGWPINGPSAIGRDSLAPIPDAMSKLDINDTVSAFAQAATRARAIGFDAIEIHMAHGYLLHQFLSPLANQRDDAYGGSLANRMRLPLEVFSAVSTAAGSNIPVGARLSGTDWVEGGWDIQQSIELAKRLEALGCAFLDISSGGIPGKQKLSLKLEAGYQVPLAAQVKAEVDVPVIAVGLITQPNHAEEILISGQADAIALARGFLNDPRWPWRAATTLGDQVTAPPQLLRALPYGHPPIFPVETPDDPIYSTHAQHRQRRNRNSHH